MVQVAPESPVSMIRRCFLRFDSNSDGQISREELHHIFHQLDPKTWTAPNVDKLIAAADLNRDGMISYTEFVEFVSSDGAGTGLGRAFRTVPESRGKGGSRQRKRRPSLG